MVNGSPRGKGSSARNMELGKCVTTMAWIRPIRLAREAAKTVPMVETNLDEVNRSCIRNGVARRTM
jgi:hypothetical protein